MLHKHCYSEVMVFTVTLTGAQLWLESPFFIYNFLFFNIAILTNSCCSVVKEIKPDQVSFIRSAWRASPHGYEHVDVTKIPDEVSTNLFSSCVFGLRSIFFPLSLYHLIRNAGFN